MIRCSSISKIMTSPKSKTAEWSQTAVDCMMDEARERLYGVRKSLDDVKAIQKGRMLEDRGIDLYNDVFLYNLEKVPASGRRDNGIITGEPDLVAATGSQKGVDIKCSWSLLTFPLTEAQARKKEYEWQARGYMCLFDVPKWEIAYCMLDTPKELLRDRDDLNEHLCEHLLQPHERITIATYERDFEIERNMLSKCEAANKYIEQLISEIKETHKNYLK